MATPEGLSPFNLPEQPIRLKHPDGRRITVPMHSGENVGVGLLRKIL